MRARLVGVLVCVVIGLFLALCPVMAQPQQAAAGSPPLEQPLIREGDLAVRLVEVLKLGEAKSETEAESLLASLDITPRNGWIADYPVTPDIVDELETSVGKAAESGKITARKEDAVKKVREVMNAYDMPVRAGISETASGETASPNYPDTTTEDSYYYDEGPPVVTYYAPPPDYAYLYTWVPYPFWWSDFWFPGYFILGDFDIDADRRRHRHDHDHNRDHDHEHDHGKFISNHVEDRKSGRTLRVDSANRSHGGLLSERAGLPTPSARRGAEAILNTNRGRVPASTYQEFRGYKASGPSAGSRSSAFERSPNSQFERNASERGFQSRSSAGRVSAGRPSGGGGFRGGGFGGSRGGIRH